jgi:redox-sensitive bicupin YhaK (pirin superfamily)
MTANLLQPRIDVRRPNDRFSTETFWLDSKHSFSFGPHDDPENTNFGLLVVSNDDIIRPETGFSTHPHRDMEIVTWVLDGELEHTDSRGNKGIIYPGLAQRMSAGSGILHSEINAVTDADVRLVQMWVVPDAGGIDPGYEQLDVSADLARGGLVRVASGRGEDSAIAIRQRDAVLWAGRLQAGETVTAPDAPFVHLYVARGAIELDGAGPLEQGAAARLTAAGGRTLVGGPEGAEVLIWEMHRDLRG